MYGKKVKLRAIFIVLIFFSAILTAILIFKSIEDNVVYFKSPSEINFVITDFKNELVVSFKGMVPNLFEEGKGVVAEGFLQDRNYLKATKILAKHDENYMPPEVKESLKGKN